MLLAAKVYGFIEFYAGLGNCSRVARMAGIRTAALDIKYKSNYSKQNYMDILSDSGLSCPR